MSMDELTENGRRRVYRVLCHLAAQDGETAAREREMLDQYRELLALSEEETDQLEAEARENKNLQLRTGKAEKALVIEAMARVMVSDGVLHPAEAKRINRVAEALRVSPREVRDALKDALRDR